MSELRMNAYYYAFEPTGVFAVDRILSAVAAAGKAYHHTEDWCDPGKNGLSNVDYIQQAAVDAAAALATARAEARKAALEEAAAVFDVYASDQRAAIAKGWLRGRGIKDSEVRAETWEDAAKELRDAAADPAIRALIEKEG